MAETDSALLIEEQLIINRNQDLRSQLISSIMEDGKIPGDNESRTLLLKTLESSDKSTFTGAKLRVDKKGNAALGGIQDALVEMFAKKRSHMAAAQQRRPEDTEVVYEVDAVEGECSTEPKSFTQEDFDAMREGVLDQMLGGK